MESKTKKRLVVVGIRRKGERGFKIKIDNSFSLPGKENVTDSITTVTRL